MVTLERGLFRRPVLAVVGTLLVLASLGLPWSRDTQLSIPGWIVPTTCIPTSDGTIWCSPGGFSPTITTGSSAAAGADSPARVFLVGAIVLVAFAVHRSSRRLVALAGLTTLAGVVLTGPVLLGGPVSAALGGLVLLRAVDVRLRDRQTWRGAPAGGTPVT